MQIHDSRKKILNHGTQVDRIGCHEFSATTNLRFFRKREFVNLFLSYPRPKLPRITYPYQARCCDQGGIIKGKPSSEVAQSDFLVYQPCRLETYLTWSPCTLLADT